MAFHSSPVSVILLDVYLATRALVSVYAEKGLEEIPANSVMSHISTIQFLGASLVNVAREV